ncbi:MAG: FixH family protein [Rhodothermales bacterium]
MNQPTTNGHAGTPHSGWQWPAFVIALLLTSVVTMSIVVFLARSDGGAQVIDDYYQKAVDYDVRRAEQARSDALGWSAAIEVTAHAEGRLVRCVIRDSAGAAVPGLNVTLTAYRPQFVDARAEVTLAATSTPGTYEAIASLEGEGLWDFYVRATTDTSAFITNVRTEL